MTRDQFRARLTALDLTCEEFAALINRNVNTVYDWGGRYGVPYDARLVLVLLEERGGAHGLLGRAPLDHAPGGWSQGQRAG